MSDSTQNELDQISINALRFLAVDQVEAAKSGHPGAPLGCAPIAYLLYTCGLTATALCFRTVTHRRFCTARCTWRASTCRSIS
jgi:transketolase N-terminal domain/subunit